MKRLVLAALLIAFPLAIVSCYSAPVIPPQGWVYAGTAAPLSLDMEASMGSKMGEAKSTSILGLVAFGDCSVNTAAKAGKITTVKHLDYKYLNIVGILQEFTTVAYGD